MPTTSEPKQNEAEESLEALLKKKHPESKELELLIKNIRILEKTPPPEYPIDPETLPNKELGTYAKLLKNESKTLHEELIFKFTFIAKDLLKEKKPLNKAALEDLDITNKTIQLVIAIHSAKTQDEINNKISRNEVTSLNEISKQFKKRDNDSHPYRRLAIGAAINFTGVLIIAASIILSIALLNPIPLLAIIPGVLLAYKGMAYGLGPLRLGAMESTQYKTYSLFKKLADNKPEPTSTQELPTPKPITPTK